MHPPFLFTLCCCSSFLLTVAGLHLFRLAALHTHLPPLLSTIASYQQQHLGPPSAYTSSLCIVLVGADYWTDWVRFAVAGNTKVQGEVKRSEGQALHTGGGPMHYLHVIILIQRTCTT